MDRCGGDIEQRPKWCEEVNYVNIGWGEVTSGRGNGKCPDRNNFALFCEEQGLWITVSEEESGSKWDHRYWVLCQSAWEAIVPTLDFIPSVKGSHLRLRAELWLDLSYIYRSISAAMYMYDCYFLPLLCILQLSLTRCFVEWVEIPSYKVCQTLVNATEDVFVGSGGFVAASKNFYVRLPSHSQSLLSWLKSSTFPVMSSFKNRFHHIISLLKNYSGCQCLQNIGITLSPSAKCYFKPLV